MVKLRSCKYAIVFVLNTQHVESCLQSFDQIRTRSASVTSEDNFGWTFVDLTDFINKCLVQDDLVNTCELIA